MYGKNAKPSEAPHAFFAHYYGSSWHSDDAAFIWFLGKWGKGLMVVGLVILVLGLVRLTIPSHKRSKIPGYDVVMPKWTQRNGRWYIDLGWFAVPASGSNTQPTSPSDSSVGHDQVPLLPLQLDMRAPSPAPSDMTSLGDVLPSSITTSASDAFRRISSKVLSFFGVSHDYSIPHSPRGRRSRQSRSVLYFLPAIFTPRDIESATPTRASSPCHSRTTSDSPLLPNKGDELDATHIPPFPTSRPGRRSGNSSIDDPYSDETTW